MLINLLGVVIAFLNNTNKISMEFLTFNGREVELIEQMTIEICRFVTNLCINPLADRNFDVEKS